MRVFITGEAGFIGRNLPASFRKLGHSVVSGDRANMRTTPKGEPCIHMNSKDQWVNFFNDSHIDLVVHNAAVVGTDVVALNQEESTLTNVAGTHNICQAAKASKIPVCYIGTSVIYDTPRYQSEPITEESIVSPSTFYGAQKLAGEFIVKSTVKDWLIMRPLFAYGGVGDMNSLIAKTFYAHRKEKVNLDMFLDPNKIKDYMHVEDFCDAVAISCDKGLWGENFNVSAEEPIPAWQIIDKMSEVCGQDLGYILRWHPDTDYLGNHVLSSKKFRLKTGWKPSYDFNRGIVKSWRSILSASEKYNPLFHLEEARNKGVNLGQFFPKKV
jgi:nucleoside-diphosphate-sugar epimerase